MSEQSEFEKWHKSVNTNLWSIDYERGIERGWQACAEQKDKEIAALREAIKYLVENVDIPTYELEMLGLVDESGKPTKVVTDSNGRKHITNEPLLHARTYTQAELDAAVAAERERCAHWAALHDHEGFAHHCIVSGRDDKDR